MGIILLSLLISTTPTLPKGSKHHFESITDSSKQFVKQIDESGALQIPCFGYVIENEDGSQTCKNEVCYADQKHPEAPSTCYVINPE